MDFDKLMQFTCSLLKWKVHEVFFTEGGILMVLGQTVLRYLTELSDFPPQ